MKYGYYKLIVFKYMYLSGELKCFISLKPV